MPKKFNYGKNYYPSGIVKTAQLPHTLHPTPHTPLPQQSNHVFPQYRKHPDYFSENLGL
ncbi:MAG: hypothetical protein O9295_09565 [Microcystis sp. LE18-22.4A]|nr:hypothetical protein [Microcystis sp. LE18-22.4A]